MLAAGVAIHLRRPTRSSGPLGWIALGFPLILALNPLAWFANEPRYLYPLAPFLALLVVAAFNKERVVHVTVAGLVILSVVGALMAARVPLALAPDAPVPADLEPLFTELETRDIDAVFAQYWLAYPIAFASDTRPMR